MLMQCSLMDRSTTLVDHMEHQNHMGHHTCTRNRHEGQVSSKFKVGLQPKVAFTHNTTARPLASPSPFSSWDLTYLYHQIIKYRRAVRPSRLGAGGGPGRARADHRVSELRPPHHVLVCVWAVPWHHLQHSSSKVSSCLCRIPGVFIEGFCTREVKIVRAHGSASEAMHEETR